MCRVIRINIQFFAHPMLSTLKWILGSASIKVLQQAMMVAPVVQTSSRTRKCLPVRERLEDDVLAEASAFEGSYFGHSSKTCSTFCCLCQRFLWVWLSLKEVLLTMSV